MIPATQKDTIELPVLFWKYRLRSHAACVTTDIEGFFASRTQWLLQQMDTVVRSHGHNDDASSHTIILSVLLCFAEVASYTGKGSGPRE